MRIAFVDTLTKLAEEDDRVWLITGDLGFSVFEPFRDRFPDRYLNVGVAEQDMIGVAAGLALMGMRPYVYSISTFASMRAYEQIRDDVCYQKLPVVIIGGGSTFSYSTFGCTHMPLEDTALMRALPGMQVVMPGDPKEVSSLLRAIHESGKPAYMRIAKRGEPVVHEPSTPLMLGKAVMLRDGTDATLMVSGRLLPTALEAAAALAAQGVHVRVVSMHTIKPLDSEAIHRAVDETGIIVTCEEHSVVGGLGEAVAAEVARMGRGIPLATLGVPDEFPSGVGSQEYFLNRYGLTASDIEKTILRLRTGHG